MTKKTLIISIILNFTNSVFSEDQIAAYEDDNSYKISSEKYITDSKGNIRMNVNIWGHVAQPGSHMVFEGIDMVTLLSLVGGPKIGAKLDKLKLIREVPDKDGKLVFTINFNEFLESGDRYSFIKIKPNDTIIIPQKFSSILLSTSGSINTILSLVTLYIQITSFL